MKSKITIKKDGKWFIASYSKFGLVTQGKTEKEAKKNINDLIKDYLENIEEPELRPEFIEEMKKIEKEKAISFKNIKELRKRYGLK